MQFISKGKVSITLTNVISVWNMHVDKSTV